MKLSAAQAQALGKVRIANSAYRSAKQNAFERATALVEEEISTYVALMDQQVRLAFEIGVPKRVIGRDGLKNSSPLAMKESLARTEGTATLSKTLAESVSEASSVYDPETRHTTLTSPAGESFDYDGYGVRVITYRHVDGGEVWDETPVLPTAEFTAWFALNEAKLLRSSRGERS